MKEGTWGDDLLHPDFRELARVGSTLRNTGQAPVHVWTVKVRQVRPMEKVNLNFQVKLCLLLGLFV